MTCTESSLVFFRFANFGVGQAITMLAFVLPEWVHNYIPGYKAHKDLFSSLFDWYRDEYNEHLKDWDADNPRDYLDVYIGERKRAEAENDTQSSFFGELGDSNYVNSMFDLFLAGSETTSTTLVFMVLYCMHYPEEMKKAQAEIDEVVGRSRLPTLSDKPNMPYIEAFIAELTRCANVAPFAVQHSNNVETTYGNYT